MAETLTGRPKELLEAPNFAQVATIADDGAPHTTITWADRDGDDVLLNSAEGRIWPRNLERDPRVTLTVANGENPYEYVAIKGRVTEITREGADDHINELSRKYLGQDEYPFRGPGEVRIIVRVEPERVHHFGE